MKKPKPRGPIPSLIGGSNGRPERVSVGKITECHRCKTPHAKGETIIKIPKIGGGFSSARKVCDDCFEQILEKTGQDLEGLRSI